MRIQSYYLFTVFIYSVQCLYASKKSSAKMFSFFSRFRMNKYIDRSNRFSICPNAIHYNMSLPSPRSCTNSDKSNDHVRVAAMDLGLRDAYFEHRLVTDSWLIGGGALFIVGCMYGYIRSLWITMSALAAIALSLSMAYFMYTTVLGFTFFPFMNMMAVIVLLGIGADDVFIYMSVWRTVLAERRLPVAERTYAQQLVGDDVADDLAAVISVTWQSARISMGVTSFTTGLAFLTTAWSSITAILCFG